MPLCGSVECIYMHIGHETLSICIFIRNISNRCASLVKEDEAKEHNSYDCNSSSQISNNNRSDVYYTYVGKRILHWNARASRFEENNST